jgi:hypothetical protein
MTAAPDPIFLFTDFSLQGPYVGQMHGAIHAVWPGAHVIDLMHDAPSMDPKASAYLLAAALRDLPRNAIIVAVVDPGVGSDRNALLLQADGRRLIGPDNGLLEIARRRAKTAQAHILQWRPEVLSASFHGRDLFAPAAAHWAQGPQPASDPMEAKDLIGHDWPDDLAQVIYCDGYGNAMTGLRAETVPPSATLTLPQGPALSQARTFFDRPQGTAFWYENSLGLVEIAVNGGNATDMFGLKIGDPINL